MTDRKQPQLVILMGVCGSGKTTVGQLLAEQLGFEFLDADSFHDAAAVAQMRSGVPLTDTIRDAWAERLCAALKAKSSATTSCVLAFSGLRSRHRRLLCALPFNTHAFMLHGSAELLAHRLQLRQNHFMPATQLTDQLRTMQAITADENVLRIPVTQSPLAIATHLRECMQTPAANPALPGSRS